MLIPSAALKTYAEALAQYHLRPEHKFRNGDYTDSGITTGRHVIPLAVRHIGKESNRWQERFFVGEVEGDIDYGATAAVSRGVLDAIRARIIGIGLRKVARLSGISRRTMAQLMKGRKIRNDVLMKIMHCMDYCKAIADA